MSMLQQYMKHLTTAPFTIHKSYEKQEFHYGK